MIGTTMLALTQAQGVILAVGGAVFLLIAGGVLFLRGRRRAEAPDIPRGMRPGPSDADLETPLLQKLQGWGVLLILFFVIWVPGTWLFEPDRNLEQERALLTNSIERGSHAVQLYTEENQTGVGCVRCHGPNLHGQPIPNTGTPDDPNDVVISPNLTTVCGGPFTGHVLIYGQRDIYTTIEQGRAPIMPSWSIKYAGALNDQQINDIVNYIISIQDKSVVTNNKNVCTNPEAQQAAIDSPQGLNGDLSKKPSPTTNVQL
jgi:mono/diheme cytochrome c family protein